MNRLTRIMAVLAIFWGLCSPADIRAQDPIGIIKEVVTEVIKALDLQVQRIQTETIGLQEFQKTLENAMSALRLDEIRDWVQEQKDLYSDYFDELRKVKTILADYHKVREIIQRQSAIVSTYRRSITLFRTDPHLTPTEISHIETVFSGILSESAKNLDRVVSTLESFTTQMTDQKCMEVIDAASTGMDKNYRDLMSFTNETELLSLHRAADAQDYEFIKKLYGL